MSGFGNAINAKNNRFKSNQKVWRYVSITLNPGEERYQTFPENNNHLQIETFQGVLGKHLTEQEIIKQGLVTGELAFSPLLK